MMKMMPIIMLLLILVVISVVFVWQGVGMHKQVITEEAKFHALQDSYFSQSKTIRDGAETGSQLNKDLVQIQQYPSSLMQLKLLGLGKILTGIFISLLAIALLLFMMPIRLGKLIKH